MNENSGGDVNYYLAEVKHPKRAEPYMVECEDIIAALGMTFFEGELFKAVWRKAAQRTLGVGKAGNTALRDAQKMAHYGARCLAIEEQAVGSVTYPVEQVLGFDPQDPRQWEPGDNVKYVRGEGNYFTPGKIYDVREVNSHNLYFVDDTGKQHTWGLGTARSAFEWVGRP